MPEGIESDDTKRQRVLRRIDTKTNDLERYIFLSSLHDTDETPYYLALTSDPARFVPLACSRGWLGLGLGRVVWLLPFRREPRHRWLQLGRWCHRYR